MSMHTRGFGRTGWSVSEVGYGLWGVGGWTGSNDDESRASIERAIELGCTFFDTALAYGAGRSEKLLGQVIARHRDRQLVIATKIPPKNMQWPALASYALDDVFPCDYVRQSTEASLTNLGIDCVDLQQLHVWTDAWANDDRWARAIDDLKREGLIRAFGLSLNRWEPESAMRMLRTGLIDSVQVVYNVFDQDPEDALFPICEELGIAVIARVPFDEGSLTGTLAPGTTWPDGDWRNLYFAPEYLRETLRRVDLVKQDVPPPMTMAEMSLRHVLSNRTVSTVIPGMRSVRHVESNMSAGDGRGLDTAVRERLQRHRWQRDYVVV